MKTRIFRITTFLGAACLLLASFPASGTVRVFIQGTNGMAWVKYESSAGEVVRSFALDVTVDHGVILGISNFLRGPSTATARGYGIFPSAFRDFVTVTSGTNADWTASGYSPLANPADNPANTQPGLNSSGVTLEFGALWDPAVPAAVPAASGTLCALSLSEAALVSIAPNTARGGLVAAPPDVLLITQFSSATVDPEIRILSTSIANGQITVLFKGGELETAPAVTGPWTGTGNFSGTQTEPLAAGPKFYRVHRTW